MSTIVRNEATTAAMGVTNVDLRLEVVVIPVSDVERAKRFYVKLGWRIDADFSDGARWRVVQVTPPGSPCSIHFGAGITTAAPGSAKNLYLITADIEAARRELNDRGAGVSAAFHYDAPGGPRVHGRDPADRSYGTYATFSDPDCNTWLLQEIKSRLPGRGVPIEVASLTELLREAEHRHGGYEATAPKHHWSGWYAAYVVARERGSDPDEAATNAARHVQGALE